MHKQLMMDLPRGYRANSKIKMKGDGIGSNSDSVLIIKLPDSRVLRIMSRSLFLAMFILTFPFIQSIIRESSSNLSDSGLGSSDLIGFESLPLVFQDLVDEGLLKKGHKGLILSSGIGDLVENMQFLNDQGIDLVIDLDLDRQSSIPNESFDFVFIPRFQSTKFINRVLKIDGIIVMLLGNDPSSNVFQQQANFKFVYIRRFDSTVIAMRKTSLVDDIENPQIRRRRLCGVTEEAKKAALNGLEDVLLEPPRRGVLAKSSNKKIKFLPNLLGDPLESYTRRIFVTDEKNGVVKWFYENYPMRNQYFEIYNLEKVVPREIGISDWLMKNTRKEDYVVVKAEAGVVERMIKEKTISLVDELFLECTNQWEDDGKKKKSKRAYWQCLALYGKVRDEGVAVHQWWG